MSQALRVFGEYEKSTLHVPIDYSLMKLEELKNLAEERGIEGYSSLKKAELIELLKG